MQPRKIALGNQKGGVGKTASTLGLGNTTGGLGVTLEEGMMTAYHLMNQTREGIAAEAIIATPWDGVDLIPADEELGKIESDGSNDLVFRLDVAFEGLDLSPYDAVLFDCPPNMGKVLFAVLIAADGVVAITEPTIDSVGGVQKLEETIDTVRKRANPKLEFDKIVISRKRSTGEHEFRESELRETYGSLVAKTSIPELAARQDAHSNRTPIHQFKGGKALTLQLAYSDLLAELPIVIGAPTHPAELIPERPPRGDATPAAPAATPPSPSADLSARKDEEEKLSMTHNTRIKPSTKDRLRRGVDKLRYETGDREISEASMTEAASAPGRGHLVFRLEDLIRGAWHDSRVGICGGHSKDLDIENGCRVRAGGEPPGREVLAARAMPCPSHLLTARSVELRRFGSAKPGANCVNNPPPHVTLRSTGTQLERHPRRALSATQKTSVDSRIRPLEIAVNPHPTQNGRNAGVQPEEIFRNQEESRRRQPAGLQTENTPCRKENPIMGDFSLRAARIQLGALIAALLIAIFIAIGITAGAFVLSFAVQRDLARQGTIPENLAWIFPVIVDSAIFGSTVAIVILSKLKMHRRDKYFYVAVAVAVVAISILGNAYHAFHSATVAQQAVAAGQSIGYTPLDPAVAAMIAVIPPVLVLAFTHGLGILIKATGIAYSDYKIEIDNAAAGVGTVATQSVVMRNETAVGAQPSLGVAE
eukprot:gene26605-31997_t